MLFFLFFPGNGECLERCLYSSLCKCEDEGRGRSEAVAEPNALKNEVCGVYILVSRFSFPLPGCVAARCHAVGATRTRVA